MGRGEISAPIIGTRFWRSHIKIEDWLEKKRPLRALRMPAAGGGKPAMSRSTGLAGECDMGWVLFVRGPRLCDLMPDNLRWSWCSTDNRNKVHNKSNTLESSKPPLPRSIKKFYSLNLVPGTKKFGNHCCVWNSQAGWSCLICIPPPWHSFNNINCVFQYLFW